LQVCNLTSYRTPLLPSIASQRAFTPIGSSQSPLLSRLQPQAITPTQSPWTQRAALDAASNGPRQTSWATVARLQPTAGNAAQDGRLARIKRFTRLCPIAFLTANLTFPENPPPRPPELPTVRKARSRGNQVTRAHSPAVTTISAAHSCARDAVAVVFVTVASTRNATAAVLPRSAGTQPAIWHQARNTIAINLLAFTDTSNARNASAAVFATSVGDQPGPASLAGSASTNSVCWPPPAHHLRRARAPSKLQFKHFHVARVTSSQRPSTQAPLRPTLRASPKPDSSKPATRTYTYMPWVPRLKV
jgi:hypothetical protein